MSHRAEAQDFEYTVVNNASVTITGYLGTDTEIDVPETIEGLPVNRIGYRAFNSLDATRIDLPNNLTTIDSQGIYGCRELTSMFVPAGVVSMAANAFLRCSGLEAIIVAPTNPEFSAFNGVLYNDSGTELIYCPEGKTGGLVVSDGVASIGDTAFQHSTLLTSIALPATVSNLDPETFLYCYALTEITVDDGNPNFSSLDGVLFNQDRTRLIKYPIGREVEHYTVPDGVAVLGNTSFSECQLTSLTLPDSLRIIESSALGSNRRLTSLVLPEGLETIESSAFLNSTLLESINIPASVTTIGPGTFRLSGNLVSIDVHPDNAAYTDLDGVLFDKSLGTLLAYPGAKTGPYTVPDGVIEIAENAFSYHNKLTAVTVPDSVETIGQFAFYSCDALTEVTVGDGVTTIARYAFGYCSNLESVKMGGAVTGIGDYAFFNCGSLASITLPGSLTNLGYYALANCTTLQGVYFEGNAPEVVQVSVLFSNSPEATAYTLSNAVGWSDTFGERPVAAWLPRIENGDDGLGVSGGAFGFNINWARGEEVAVDGAVDVENPNWTQLGVVTLEGPDSRFEDADWELQPSRFYRVRQDP